jgi:hypothetical protein
MIAVTRAPSAMSLRCEAGTLSRVRSAPVVHPRHNKSGTDPRRRLRPPIRQIQVFDRVSCTLASYRQDCCAAPSHRGCSSPELAGPVVTLIHCLSSGSPTRGRKLGTQSPRCDPRRGLPMRGRSVCSATTVSDRISCRAERGRLPGCASGEALPRAPDAGQRASAHTETRPRRFAQQAGHPVWPRDRFAGVVSHS